MNQQEELKRLRELVVKLQNQKQNLRVQNETLTQAVLHAEIQKILSGAPNTVIINLGAGYSLFQR